VAAHRQHAADETGHVRIIDLPSPRRDHPGDPALAAEIRPAPQVVPASFNYGKCLVDQLPCPLAFFDLRGKSSQPHRFVAGMRDPVDHALGPIRVGLRQP
jgi:hypothetical protein